MNFKEAFLINRFTVQTEKMETKTFHLSYFKHESIFMVTSINLLEIEYFLSYHLKQQLFELENIPLRELWWFYKRHEKTLKTLEQQQEQAEGGQRFQTESFI